MRYTFLSLFLLITISASAVVESKFGEDSVSCVTNISLYREYVKQKNYDDALSPWRKAYINCPKATKNIYIDGAKIFNYLINKSKGNEELQKAYLDTLSTIYDNRVVHFGKREYVLGLKGSDMLKYSFADLDLAFEYLKESVEGLQNKSKATALFSYFKAATQKFQEKTFTKAQVLEVYAAVSDYLEYNLSNESKSKKFYEKASENVEKLFVPFATCEDLIAMFDAKYQETPDDLTLIKRIVKVLDKKDCTDATVYFEAATKLHESEPSALSAYNMGNLSLRKNKYSQAIGFYNQALEMAENDEDKANYYYGLSGAYFKSGSNSSARSYAYKAIDIKPSWGKPFVLIGDIYAASANECGSNSFESAMLYSAAIDKFITAKSKDSSVGDFADKKIASYSKYLPSNEDAFFNGFKEGDSYTVGCWINESTKVRIK
ncbi:tetratricopeptide repeat protein [Flavobacteriales bacterium]|nr:tetratricopeptide repeat protein [Flavobacteriales bacterium]